MKKIIATVLAMVMALALCVTAFAATTYAGYGPDGKEITKDAKYTYEKVDADYNRDNGHGNVAYYWVKAGDETYGYFVSADAKSYDLKLTCIWLSWMPRVTLTMTTRLPCSPRSVTSAASSTWRRTRPVMSCPSRTRPPIMSPLPRAATTCWSTARS